MSARLESRVQLPRASQSTGEDMLLRLALWLAEVSAEATLAATPPTAVSTPGAEARRHALDREDAPVTEMVR